MLFFYFKNCDMDKELKNEIYDQLDNLFSKYYTRDKFQFEKPILRYGNSDFQINLAQTSEYHNDIHFQITLVAIDKNICEIKKILFIDNPTSYILFKLQENIGDIEVFGYQTSVSGWSLYGVEDCKRIYDDHVQFMEQVGHAFLNRYSSLEGIHQFLNLKYLNEFDPDGDIDHYRKIKSFFGEREILSGLIASYLINYEDIERLIYQYKLLYKHKNMDVLLDKVVDYFKK
jgi:hypothetical protein